MCKKIVASQRHSNSLRTHARTHTHARAHTHTHAHTYTHAHQPHAMVQRHATLSNRLTHWNAHSLKPPQPHTGVHGTYTRLEEHKCSGHISRTIGIIHVTQYANYTYTRFGNVSMTTYLFQKYYARQAGHHLIVYNLPDRLRLKLCDPTIPCFITVLSSVCSKILSWGYNVCAMPSGFIGKRFAKTFSLSTWAMQDIWNPMLEWGTLTTKHFVHAWYTQCGLRPSRTC